MPPPIDQQVTFLYTHDLAATAAFYANVLGLRCVLNQGPCRIYHVTGEAFVGFCAFENARVPQRDEKTVVFTMVSDEVDAWHARLVAAGVEIEKPPTMNEQFNIYHIFFRDPNGYLLEIQRFCDPAWPRAGTL